MGNMQMKHSTMELLQERHRFLSMSPQEKRQYYSTPQYISLSTIPPWPLYYTDQGLQSDESSKRMYKINPEINNRVSIWRGDITLIEIDAIVNSVSNPEKCGEVNKLIMEKAGEYFRDECILNGIPTRGGTMVTAGYKLPAKYVVNALAPKEQEEDILRDCYKNSLNAAADNDIRTIAFPCIATRKKNAFPSELAATIALDTVRKWLEIDDNRRKIDDVIFCLYKREDVLIYTKQMQVYFPIED